MKTAIAQLNCVVGDIDGNVERIQTAIARAQAASADLLLTPELSLCGYSPQDLLLRDDFIAACTGRLAWLARQSGAMAVVVGHPAAAGGQLFNCASVLRRGRIEATYRKQCLPNRGAFDELRYFAAGDEPLVIAVGGTRVGLLVCADIWEAAPALRARDAGADVLAVINASPWHLGKPDERIEVAGERVADTGLGLLYANRIGGEEELVFDGASFVMDARGGIVGRLPAFSESFAVFEMDGRRLLPGPNTAGPAPLESLWQALIAGVRDFCTKNGHAGVLVGLTGEPATALVLAVAVAALGADAVVAALPSAETANARAQADHFGVRTVDMPATATLAALWQDGDTERAGMAPVVGAFSLTVLAQCHGRLLLTACDKTEYALGVVVPGPIGLAVLADVSRSRMQALAHWCVRRAILPKQPAIQPVVPPWPDNTSAAVSALSCELLDAIIEAYVERELPPADIVAAGLSPTAVAQVIDCIERGERNRRQAPPGIRVTPRSFGCDRRYPAQHRYRAYGRAAENRDDIVGKAKKIK